MSIRLTAQQKQFISGENPELSGTCNELLNFLRPIRDYDIAARDFEENNWFVSSVGSCSGCCITSFLGAMFLGMAAAIVTEFISLDMDALTSACVLTSIEYPFLIWMYKIFFHNGKTVDGKLRGFVYPFIKLLSQDVSDKPIKMTADLTGHPEEKKLSDEAMKEIGKTPLRYPYDLKVWVTKWFSFDAIMADKSKLSVDITEVLSKKTKYKRKGRTKSNSKCKNTIKARMQFDAAKFSVPTSEIETRLGVIEASQKDGVLVLSLKTAVESEGYEKSHNDVYEAMVNVMSTLYSAVEPR